MGCLRTKRCHHRLSNVCQLQGPIVSNCSKYGQACANSKGPIVSNRIFFLNATPHSNYMMRCSTPVQSAGCTNPQFSCTSASSHDVCRSIGLGTWIDAWCCGAGCHRVFIKRIDGRVMFSGSLQCTKMITLAAGLTPTRQWTIASHDLLHPLVEEEKSWLTLLSLLKKRSCSETSPIFQ